MSGFTDFLKVQRYVAHMLLSDDWLANVNIVTRDWILANGSQLKDETLAQETLVYVTPRNGREGCGVIVEKPRFVVGAPNLPGPQGDLVITCLILADPINNWSPTLGAKLPGNQVGQRILELAHGWRINPAGSFFADQSALVEANDWSPLDAWRVNLRLRLPRYQSSAVAEPVITIAAGVATITCPTADAEIFFTIDDSFPAHERGGNPGSARYTAPFPVASGTGLLACAYKAGLNQSNVVTKTAP